MSAVVPPVLPLFPLPNVVLFPLMPMPLHVFEPRYRQMVDEVLATHRTIGMVLLRPGWEHDYHGRPPVYLAGCAGRMEQCEQLANGRFNIVLRGLSRFRILEEQGGKPYRLARIDLLPDPPGDAVRLEEARQQVIAALDQRTGAPANVLEQMELPHETFVNALCQSLELTPIEKQSLLDAESIQARYDRLLEILEFNALEGRLPRRNDAVH